MGKGKFSDAFKWDAVTQVTEERHILKYPA